MKRNIAESAHEFGGGFIGKATILRTNIEGRGAWIHLDSLPGIHEFFAEDALGYGASFTEGDSVLVAGDDRGNFYIVGFLSPKKRSALHTPNGACAVVGNGKERNVFKLFSKNGKLILKYDTENGKLHLSSVSREIELSAGESNMIFRSSKDISFEAEAIHLKGRKVFNASVQSELHQQGPVFQLEKNSGTLSCPDFKISTKRIRFFSNELIFNARKVLGNLVKVLLNTEKLETRAQNIISKCKNIYQSVEGLSQLKADRFKALISSSYHLKSKKSVLKSEEDFKVRAERINLG